MRIRIAQFGRTTNVKPARFHSLSAYAEKIVVRFGILAHPDQLAWEPNTDAIWGPITRDVAAAFVALLAAPGVAMRTSLKSFQVRQQLLGNMVAKKENEAE
jgi:hypothetical protein